MMQGGRVQERARRGRGVTVAETGGGGAVVWRESGVRDLLSEEADGSRRRAVTCDTGRRAEGHGQSWGQADVPAGSGSGRGMSTEEAELVVPSQE